MPYCPIHERRVVYLDCQECERKICKEIVINPKKQNKASSISVEDDDSDDEVKRKILMAAVLTLPVVGLVLAVVLWSML